MRTLVWGELRHWRGSQSGSTSDPVQGCGTEGKTGGRTAEPALSDVAVDASRVAGVAQVGQPERRQLAHVHGHVVAWTEQTRNVSEERWEDTERTSLTP